MTLSLFSSFWDISYILSLSTIWICFHGFIFKKKKKNLILVVLFHTEMFQALWIFPFGHLLLPWFAVMLVTGASCVVSFGRAWDIHNCTKLWIFSPTECQGIPCTTCLLIQLNRLLFFLYILMFSNYMSQSAGDASQGLKVSRRIASLERFREKRKERCFEKKVRYTCRKEVAQR